MEGIQHRRECSQAQSLVEGPSLEGWTVVRCPECNRAAWYGTKQEAIMSGTVDAALGYRVRGAV